MKKLLLLPILGLMFPNLGSAANIAFFKSGDVSITLTDEDCRLKDAVTNLPKRAVWRENGKPVDGCFGYIQQIGMITCYFADKTATALCVSLRSFPRTSTFNFLLPGETWSVSRTRPFLKAKNRIFLDTVLLKAARSTSWSVEPHPDRPPGERMLEADGQLRLRGVGGWRRGGRE